MPPGRAKAGVTNRHRESARKHRTGAPPLSTSFEVPHGDIDNGVSCRDRSRPIADELQHMSSMLAPGDGGRLLPGVGAGARHANGNDDAWMGARWMPWLAGPMKGAGTRRNTSGSGSHALIRGCPNGAIRHG